MHALQPENVSSLDARNDDNLSPVLFSSVLGSTVQQQQQQQRLTGGENDSKPLLSLPSLPLPTIDSMCTSDGASAISSDSASVSSNDAAHQQRRSSDKVTTANETSLATSVQELLRHPAVKVTQLPVATQWANKLQHSRTLSVTANDANSAASAAPAIATSAGLVLSWENVNVFSKKKTARPKSDSSMASVFSSVKAVHRRSPIFDISQNRSSDLMWKTAPQKEINAISYRSSSFANDSMSTESVSSVASSNTKSYQNSQLLNNVSGLVRSGECLAIMGASGAGKTTLLNVLNFRNLKKFNFSHSIRLNGRLVSANSSELVARSAYIQQEDLFFNTLTVKEHLTFLAMLKMDAGFTSQQKRNRVEEIIQEFNLEKCKNTKIGSHDQKKGISGGEKRRLSFASEILTDPVILFCDEPTSGLDSHMALSIVNTLSNLASKGKAVICTIHQPSSQVFDRFNKLCLLAEGRVAFFGNREEAFDFFKSISFECPIKYNPADYYIEILAHKSKNKDNRDTIRAICDSYEKSPYFEKVRTDFNDITRSFSSKSSSRYHSTSAELSYKASYLTQLMWLMWRQLKNVSREPFASRILVIQSIITGIFLGFTYFQQDFDQESIQNKNGLLFMVLMQTCLTYMFVVASQFHEQWNVVYRDGKNRVYSVVIYHLAKTLSELPQNVIFPALTVTIVYWLAKIHMSYVVFLSITSLIVVASNTASGFGSFLAAVTPNLNATMALIGPTFFPLLIFSGFLINADSIPVYFVWIKYTSWFFYANEAIMILLWTNVDQIRCPYNGIITNIINITNDSSQAKPSVIPTMTTTTTSASSSSSASAIISLVTAALNSSTSINNSTTNSAFAPASVACVQQCLLNGGQVLSQLSMNKNNLNLDIAMLLVMLVAWPTVAGLLIYFRAKK